MATAIATAAKSGKMDEANEAFAKMNAHCNACHGLGGKTLTSELRAGRGSSGSSIELKWLRVQSRAHAVSRGSPFPSKVAHEHVSVCRHQPTRQLLAGGGGHGTALRQCRGGAIECGAHVPAKSAELLERSSVNGAPLTEGETAGPRETGPPREGAGDVQSGPALLGFGKAAIDQSGEAALGPSRGRRASHVFEGAYHQIRQAVDVQRRCEHEEVGFGQSR